MFKVIEGDHNYPGKYISVGWDDNRIGKEIGKSCEITFYGSSFITNYTGAKIAEASRDTEEIIYADFDLEENASQREYWGLLRDRKPSMYEQLTQE